MLDVTVLLPACDWSGTRLPAGAIEAMVDRLAAGFGQGVLWEEQRGVGLEPDRRTGPVVRPFVMVLNVERLPELRQVLDQLGQTWNQTAMFLKVARPELEMIEIDAAGPREAELPGAIWRQTWERRRAWQQSHAEQVCLWHKQWRRHGGVMDQGRPIPRPHQTPPGPVPPPRPAPARAAARRRFGHSPQRPRRITPGNQ